MISSPVAHLAPQFSSMEHAKFTFGLVSDIAKAHRFPHFKDASTFAEGIQEGSVHPYAAGRPACFVAKVGPWMYVRDIKPRAES